jgi:hypothetical protein
VLLKSEEVSPYAIKIMAWRSIQAIILPKDLELRSEKVFLGFKYMKNETTRVEVFL